jgi:hypothetical protein
VLGGVVVLGAVRVALVHQAHQRGWLDDAEIAMQLQPPQPRFPWRLVSGKFWQITRDEDALEPMALTDAREQTGGGCPARMVRVRGRFKLDRFGRESSGEVEELQNSTCTSWISRDFPARCATFDRAKWLSVAASLPDKAIDVCVDRFEYPNVAGAYPVIMVSYVEAQAVCAGSGKRLCTETEWTFACEGEEAMPYPYGYDRDPSACVVDSPWRAVSAAALSPRSSNAARDEIDRLWQGQPSGTRPRCRSAFGVYDMTGNIDEWTRSVRSGERPSIMKGGYWGPVRARCRPSTRAHGEEFVHYQQGFRCCANPPAGDAPGAAGEPAAPTLPVPAPPEAVEGAAREGAASGATPSGGAPAPNDGTPSSGNAPAGGAAPARDANDAGSNTDAARKGASAAPAAPSADAPIGALAQGADAGDLNDDELDAIARMNGSCTSATAGLRAAATAPFGLALASAAWLARRRARVSGRSSR